VLLIHSSVIAVKSVDGKITLITTSDFHVYLTVKVYPSLRFINNGSSISLVTVRFDRPRNYEPRPKVTLLVMNSAGRGLKI